MSVLFGFVLSQDISDRNKYGCILRMAQDCEYLYHLILALRLPFDLLGLGWHVLGVQRTK